MAANGYTPTPFENMNKNFYETEMSFKGSQDKVIHFGYILHSQKRILTSGNTLKNSGLGRKNLLLKR